MPTQDRLTYKVQILGDMYLDRGMSIRDISKETHCSRAWLSRRLKDNGVTLRRRGCLEDADGWRKYHFDDSVFSKCDSPDKAYWLGFLMADGAIFKTSNGTWSVTLGLQERDSGHVELLRNTFSFPQPVGKMTQWLNGKPYVKSLIRICSHRLVDDLERYGITERKSGLEEINNIPKEYLRDFIRGYFDGDGSAGVYGKGNGFLRLSFTSASATILEQIRKILSKHGAKAGCSIRRVAQGGKVLALTYYDKRSVENIPEFLYRGAHTFLGRKLEIIQGWLGWQIASPIN